MLNNSIFSLQKRLLAGFVLVTFVFVAIIIRLGFVQLGKGEWLREMAAEQWFRDLPLKAQRGNIVDANGSVLASSVSTYDVYVRANRVTQPTQVAVFLSTTLGLDYESVYAKVTNKAVGESSIKLRVDDLTAKKIVSAGFDGVVLSESSMRYYPYGDLLTQVLGFTTVDNVGQTGLEVGYERYLQGINGYALEESDVHGVKIDNTLSTYIPAIKGMNLELTIDVNVQSYLENALNTLMLEQEPKSATGIVMNPNTGEILAMSTKPSYDLNNVPRNDIASLLQMSRNVSVCDVYEPGSTFKVITMASAVEEGVAHLTDHFYDPGYRMVDGEKIKCWKLTGHGSQTLSEGLCNSCNSVFIDLALRLGKDKLYEYFDTFGLGKTLGVDFMGEASGLLMDKDSVKTVDYARMGFGQAVAVSPLQLITAFCSVVNGGNLMQPYFVKSIYDDNGNVAYVNSPKIIRRTVSEKTSRIMQTMVEDVVKQYSGINAFIPGYRVGGKTGTTQKYADGKISGTYIASFVGTFPAEKPEYVVLILADEPSKGSYYGSVVATPYAKMIIEQIIRYKNYKPNNLEEDLVAMEKNIPMPNLVGMDIYTAVNKLTELGLQCEIEGEGDFVTFQYPPEGTMMFKNAICVLSTE